MLMQLMPIQIWESFGAELAEAQLPDLIYVLKKSCSSRAEGAMNTRAYRGFSSLVSSDGLICE